ncbi:MAG: hypothetical protein WKF90_12090 [Pyrinomonadaceae bacterium]
MKSEQIETELNNATKRLDELTEMRDGITTNLQTLQSGFIGGETLLDELQSEQAKLTILNESIKALEAKQNELHAAFQLVSLSESRSATLKQMKVIASEAETAFSEYVSQRNDFDRVIKEHAEKTFAALAAFRGKQGDFFENLRQVAPDVSSLQTISADASDSYRKVVGELKDIGLSGAAFGLATAAHLPKLPDAAFPDVLNLAEQIIGNRKSREEQAVRRAASAADRLKRNAAQEAKQQEQRAERSRQLEAEQKQIAAYRAKNKMPLFSPADLALAARESLAAASAKQ